MSADHRWQQIDLSEILNRLTEAKQLLEQAAALAAAQEGDKVRAMADLQRQKAEEVYGGRQRRRHR